MGIVVDSRTDSEKLLELLGEPEQRALEYKRQLDLDNLKTSLEFVKDVVGMSNTGGSYLIVGATDDGKPCAPLGAFHRASYDAAKLNDKVRSYTNREAGLVSRVHELNGHELILIFVAPSPAGLPVPMTKNGQHEVGGKPKWVFRKGDVIVRSDAQNVLLDHSHWDMLLERHDERIREEVRRDMDELFNRLARAQSAGPATLPLDPSMDEDVFARTVVAHLDAGSAGQLNTFVAGAGTRYLSVGPQDTGSLDQLVAIGAQALFYDRDQLFERVVSQLHQTYVRAGFNEPVRRLAVIDRVYVLGSCAVRAAKWAAVRLLTLKDAENNHYGGWIREGQVRASNENILSDKPGLMISTARHLMSQHPSLRPDLASLDLAEPSSVDLSDVLLNSLCRYDILHCLVLAVERPGKSSYPASAAFDQQRSEPVLEQLVSDTAVQTQLLPGATAHDLSLALITVLNSARSSALSEGLHWFNPPQSVADFVSQHE